MAPTCKNCSRLIRPDGTCGCPEETRRTCEFAGLAIIAAVAVAMVAVLIGVLNA